MASELGLSGDEPLPAATRRSTVRVGSRKSQLALVQTNWVLAHLQEQHPSVHFELITLDTVGDNILDRPLAQIGEKALFTRELEEELLAGNIDLIVHSLKDLPTTLPDQCCIGAITRREDPTDSLVLRKGLSLPPNSSLESILANPQIQTFGTSSLRRIAQLRAQYPQVAVKDVRGNLNTRLRKLDTHAEFGFDCLVLATAGLKRGGFEERISQRLDWYHAVGQGALGVECRSNDTFVLEQIIAPLVDTKAMLECTAERVLMKCLEGGCSVPIGVRTSWPAQDTLKLEAIVLSLDGTQRVQADMSQLLNDFGSVQGHRFSLHDYADAIVPGREQCFELRMKNAVLLGRSLAAQMIDMGVKVILDQIVRDKSASGS